MKNGVQWVKKDPEKKDVYWPSEEMKKIAWVSDESIYKKASENPYRIEQMRILNKKKGRKSRVLLFHQYPDIIGVFDISFRSTKSSPSASDHLNT